MSWQGPREALQDSEGC